MKIGIYEQIINNLIKSKIDSVDKEVFYVGSKPIKKENAARYLSRYLQDVIQNVINTLPDDATIEQEISLINDIISLIRDKFYITNLDQDLIMAGGEILTAVIKRSECDYSDIDKYLSEITPSNSVSESILFTGGSGQNTLLSELKKEIRSCDEVHLIVSFIKNSGLNLLIKELRNLVEKGKKLKVITTTYVQNTDYEAVRRLALLPNTEVKISYNVSNDRLHAKSYIFLRDTGFSTAYIGSSNISVPALTTGMEWNIKATSVVLPQIIKCVESSFQTCWESETFETFVPGRDDARLKFALGFDVDDESGIDWSQFDLIRAKHYQNEVLDKLTVERDEKKRFRNLIVAATGTGKTVISAFDYKRFAEINPGARLLFVAHREEILKQALSVYRHVLKDENFGDLWFAGKNPSSFAHLFASKDTIYSRLKSGKWEVSPTFYDYVVIDEAHHVLADTYKPLINYFKPKILLGMTATPERNDGDIKVFFDGAISAEIRLADALRNGLLVPFHYYGITDCVDLSSVNWKRGEKAIEYELTRLYTENDRRTELILRKLQETIGISGLNKTKALGFCVSVDHARYMAAKLTLAGLKAEYLTSENNHNRSSVIKRFSKGEINYLFVVDMFNEGVDIPAIDTVLFLRQTESLTIYLQQFGRGLRKFEGKEFLTVLDFVGNGDGNFHYAERFRSLIGKTGLSIREEVDAEFPHLPFGSVIELEIKAREFIIDNIDKALKSYGVNNIINNIKIFSEHYNVELNLLNFIDKTQIPLEKLYNGKRTFGQLCEVAGVSENNVTKFSTELSRAVSRKWLATDSFSYFSFLSDIIKAEFNFNVSAISQKEKMMLTMFYYDMFQEPGIFVSLQDMLDELSKDKQLIDELGQLMVLFKNRAQTLELKIPAPAFNTNFPLMVHGRYTKDQICVALGTSDILRKSTCREGVERNKSLNIEAMYVDLIKERDEGSTTDYDDLAISDTLFDWQTQNKVTQSSPTGKNYYNQSQTMLLFVREQAKDPEERQRRMGYIYLGEVSFVQWSGNAPINIRWRLRNPMPASLWQFAGKFAMEG